MKKELNWNFSCIRYMLILSNQKKIREVINFVDSSGKFLKSRAKTRGNVLQQRFSIFKINSRIKFQYDKLTPCIYM